MNPLPKYTIDSKDYRIILFSICRIMILDNPAACVRAWCVEHKPYDFSFFCPQVIFVSYSYSTTTTERVSRPSKLYKVPNNAPPSYRFQPMS